MGKILGLDIGDRRIGVAISDELGLLARPVEIIDRRKIDPVARLCEIAKQESVTTVVVGLARNMDGSEGTQAKKCREFASLLEKNLPNVSIVMWDERLSTKAAKRVAVETRSKSQRRTQSLDATSACFILQGYLDFLKCRHEAETENGEPHL